MSATPIPRTLALILYSDLDISVIDELPSNRLPIKNCVVDTSYRTTAYNFMKKQIAEGRQCYIIFNFYYIKFIYGNKIFSLEVFT